VYVQAFPLTSDKYPISTNDGGIDPAWGRDGAELFYMAPDRSLMAVPVRSTAHSFEPGIPRRLYKIPRAGIRRNFAVSADGRFLVAKPPDDGAREPVTVELSWRAARDR
jgi:hypothetical protein